MIGIVGGGPAGLVAAIAARQAGFEVTVFERAPSFERIGGAVGIQDNGLCVLEALGLLDAFRPFIEIAHSATLEAPPGRVLYRADFREIGLRHHGFAVALRYDLQELLLQSLLAHGVAIQFGRHCNGASAESDEVTLRFADGTTVSCDLVFACDGVHSIVRDSLGLRVRRRIANESYLRLVAPRKHPEPSRIGEYWAQDGRRAGAFPLPGDRTYVFCSVPLGEWRDILSYRLEAWIASWDSFGDPVTTLIRSINDWPNAVYDELQDIRVAPWCSGRVFVLGDAAHAMTPNLGQGANSAMVDALVLINLLVECGGEGGWREAGQRYQQIRKPFVTRIQDAAWLGGRIASWRSASARALRDRFLMLGARFTPMRRASMRLTAGFNPAERPYLRKVTSDTSQVTRK